jgi:hypothetical protein
MPRRICDVVNVEEAGQRHASGQPHDLFKSGVDDDVVLPACVDRFGQNPLAPVIDAVGGAGEERPPEQSGGE